MAINILGISAYYHDSAACLVQDGVILSAVQEERFTRIKNDSSFPERAIEYCLSNAALTIDDIDIVVFYDKPFLKFDRLLHTILEYAPFGFASFRKAIPLWLKEKLWLKEDIHSRLEFDGKILFTEHHESHAASAFFTSPFQEAAFITMDGVGEWTTTSWGIGKDNHLEIQAEIHFPHSLGLLYSAFTYFTGFKVNSDEYKVMGLAPYGEPKYRDLILRELIDLKEDGSYRLNMDYFDYCVGLKMTNDKFSKLFGGPPRKPDSPITQREMDLARSIQAVTEEAVLRMTRHVHGETGMKNLCLAGGVALNCVANGRIATESSFEHIWIQPAAGDAGGALGAALFAWFQYLGNERKTEDSMDTQRGSLLGPSFSNEEIEIFLQEQNYPFERLDDDELVDRVAELLADGKVVGWFQGRMEFGPRALGARSILGDARSPVMQEKINRKIKFRESFRPFAPSVLSDRASELFDLRQDSPYMLLVAPVQSSIPHDSSNGQESLEGLDRLRAIRSDLPAITHVDGSARIQTVSEDVNPLYYRLLKCFEEKTDCPAIVNTSFNVRDEPVVCTPKEAYRCFMQTHLDYLALGNCLLDKQAQREAGRAQSRTVEYFDWSRA